MRESPYNLLKKTNAFNFLKWGEYMKRAQLAERKVEKLKRLLLLTDECVSYYRMNEMTLTQWTNFIAEFPDENPTKPTKELG
jgi:hypothetical protein